MSNARRKMRKPNFGFARKKPMIAGLHAAARRLRFVCLDAAQPSGYILKAVERPLPSGLIIQGRVADSANFTDELRVTVDEEGLMRVKTVMCVLLQSGTVFIKRFAVPRASLEVVRAGLVNHRSINQSISDPENTVLQAAILGENTENGAATMPILAIVAKKDVIESRQVAGIESGLLIEAIDVDALAIYNCFARCSPQAASEMSLIVHVGDEGTVILVSDRNGPVLARQAPVGLEHLAEEIAASQSNLSTDAVWQMLVDGKASPDRWPEAFDSWKTRICTTVHQSVNSLLKAKTNSPAAGFLCGDGIALPGFGDKFSESLSDMGFPIRIFNPMDTLGTDPAIGMEPRVDGTAYTLTLGLALRQMED